MDSSIQISKLNDFIFCPYSVYLHSVYERFNQKTYHSTFQTVGKICHENIEQGRYTTSKLVLQGIEVYSEKYGLIGKVDIFDARIGALVERKYKIKKIFDGYKYQLYAQMFCLEEMGYQVKKLFIHSLSDNKRYSIPLPTENDVAKLKKILNDMEEWQPSLPINQNPAKCQRCIYKSLCH